MNKWMNEQMNEWMNEWMNERMNEWIDGWMTTERGFGVMDNEVVYNISLIMRKPAFGVCDQVRLKPACSATEAS